MFLGSDLHRHRGTIQVHERAPWRSDGAILGPSPLVVLQSASSPPNPHAMSSARRTSSHRVSNRLAQDWTNSITLGQRYVVEVQRARGRHPVVRRQDYLSRQSTNCPRRRYDDDLVQTFNDGVSSENQHRPPLIGKPKGVPADLAALHWTPSQPPASQASGSSSAENSSREGGADR